MLEVVISECQYILGKAAESETNSDIYAISGRIDYRTSSELSRRIRSGRVRDKVILVVETTSGNFEQAHKIVRNLRQHYDLISVFVPTSCIGAGTLIALSADEVFLGRDAQIGPFDGDDRRILMLSPKAGKRAFEHMATVDPNVGFVIDPETRHLFANVSEPPDTLTKLAEMLLDGSACSIVGQPFVTTLHVHRRAERVE